ncbi:glycoside hydrolase [Massilia sp. PAMC28688]|uniref:sialidase family protein n=1 Tax=Massilia sp. PAMC28688 TaxID=2861283 RepID=UPI001C6324AD|nr:sialidase family protein [Massilia sp. PAMC28688]QYF93432.1 glycoside hydrolase [Massilia sp. PAMC28688]
MTRTALPAIVLAAVLLTACTVPAAPPAPALPHPHGRVDVLLSHERGMGSIAFDARHTYLALANSATSGSAILRGGTVLNRATVWRSVDLGDCILGPARSGAPLRTPVLARLAGSIYLFQPLTGGVDERSLCKLERPYEWFAPRDEALRMCRDTTCTRLWMTQLALAGGALLSNAGGGINVLASADDGRSWRALLGELAQHGCSHASFTVSGRRLLVGGACAQDASYLKAYRLGGDGSLASSQALPVALPPLGQHRLKLLQRAGSPGTVFAGVAGGLLRSTDHGENFHFVILHPPQSAAFPTISSVLALRKRPQVLVAAGADHVSGKPYLAVSRDGGARWTDLSNILPGHDGAGPGGAAVTSLAQDPAGRVLLTLNLQPQSQGRLLMLTLGGVD